MGFLTFFFGRQAGSGMMNYHRFFGSFFFGLYVFPIEGVRLRGGKRGGGRENLSGRVF